MPRGHIGSTEQSVPRQPSRQAHLPSTHVPRPEQSLVHTGLSHLPVEPTAHPEKQMQSSEWRSHRPFGPQGNLLGLIGPIPSPSWPAHGPAWSGRTGGAVTAVKAAPLLMLAY